MKSHDRRIREVHGYARHFSIYTILKISDKENRSFVSSHVIMYSPMIAMRHHDTYAINKGQAELIGVVQGLDI